MTDRAMWEIFVPTIRNDGRPFRTRYHKVWDKKVQEITGGLTIMSPVKGIWVSHVGDEYDERMIPVRILATRDEMVKICAFTKNYYEQLAVLAYRISNEYIYDSDEEETV